MAKKAIVTENRMATRICEREDNHYYKHKMIREILHMYADEIYKALLKGGKNTDYRSRCNYSRYKGA